MEKHLFPDGEKLPRNEPPLEKPGWEMQNEIVHSLLPRCSESLKNLFLCLILQTFPPHFVE